MAVKAPETPWWFEAYQDSTVLIAYIANFDSIYKSKPESQLFFLHQLVQQLDAIVLRSGQQLWRMHGFSLPFYCVLCPQCNTANHANLVFELALELSAAAAQINLPSGDPVDLRLGLASGSSATGVIGASGVTFVVTGKIAQGARHFAQNTSYLTVSEDTWRKLSLENKNQGTWCRSACSDVPALGHYACLDFHIPPASSSLPSPSSITPAAADGVHIPEFTLSDISDEIAVYERPDATQWLWPGYNHPGIEHSFNCWLGKELGTMDHIALLLALLVLLSSQLRMMKDGPLRLEGARTAFVGLPLLLVLIQGRFPSMWLHGREILWLTLVLIRKLLPAFSLCSVLLGRQPLFLSPPEGGTAVSSPVLPHVADLFDCLTGMLLCRVGLQWQMAASAASGIISVVVALLHLRAGITSPQDVMLAWLLASVALLLQAALAIRWEHHQRLHFLTYLSHRNSAKPGHASPTCGQTSAGLHKRACGFAAASSGLGKKIT